MNTEIELEENQLLSLRLVNIAKKQVDPIGLAWS